MATPRYPGPLNVFVPSATSQVIAFLKSATEYKIRKYTQWFGSKDKMNTGKPIAGYWIYDPDAPVRIGPNIAPTANVDPQGIGPGPDNIYRWDPATDRPPANITGNFKLITVQMDRRNYGYQLDEQTDETADLPIRNIFRQQALNYAMKMKTWRVIKMLELVANWPTTNTADANTLNGGKGTWDKASSDELSPTAYAIRKSIIAAVIQIVLQTNGAVRVGDLRCVISPNLAFAMGSSGEIYGYVKSSAFSQERQEGKNELMESYGMPRFYAGMEFIVEDEVVVTDEMNALGTPATTGRVFIKNDTSAIIVARPGSVDGVAGAPSFSTVQVWFYKYEMAVEEHRDVWNKQEKGAVVDQFAEVPAALRAGFLVTNTL